MGKGYLPFTLTSKLKLIDTPGKKKRDSQTEWNSLKELKEFHDSICLVIVIMDTLTTCSMMDNKHGAMPWSEGGSMDTPLYHSSVYNDDKNDHTDVSSNR